MQKLKLLTELKNEVWDKESKKNLERALTKKHELYLREEQFLLDAYYGEGQIQLSVTLKKADDSMVYPIECIHVFSDKTPPLKEIQNTAGIILDYIDCYWLEFFENDRQVFLPLDWSHHESNGHTFYMRGFIRNLILENEADQLLKSHGFGEYAIEPISSET